MIKIEDQRWISRPGKRTNNEDKVGMTKGSTYVVCDGVGGAEKGEVASEIVVNTILETLRYNFSATIEQALLMAEQQLTSYIESNPSSTGMATTLAFSRICPTSIEVAWVGDSRIYQFRKGSIVFRTQDHSWVNEAIRAGIITPSEAENHPKSSVITRAVQGSHRPVVAEIAFLSDIQKGDYFFHCTDGVLEAWSDDDLMALFSSEKDCQAIMAKLQMECEKDSRDNFTALVYKIKEAPANTSTIPKDINQNENINYETDEVLPSRVWKYLLFITLAICLTLVYFQFFHSSLKTSVPKEKVEIKSQKRVSIQPINPGAGSMSSEKSSSAPVQSTKSGANNSRQHEILNQDQNATPHTFKKIR